MNRLSRRTFIKNSALTGAGSLLLPQLTEAFKHKKISNTGLQLYTFRDELLADAVGTLKQIAALGIKQIESASSDKGHYYGLSAKEIKNICSDLGMTIRSGHVGLDNKWKQTMDEAAESGQEYLICSSMPIKGQRVDNYKKTAEQFNKAGEECNKLGIKFGYHNHDYEFEMESGEVLYDVLLKNTEAHLVHMEMDCGWVTVVGKNPLDYFKKYPGRFPLWHLKDMIVAKKKSTEFGKGDLKIAELFHHSKQAGLKYFFIEQEDYTSTPLESMKYNVDYLKKLKV